MRTVLVRLENIWSSIVGKRPRQLAVCSLCLLTVITLTTAFQSTVAADNATDQKIQANQLLGAYCVTCHGNDTREGDIQLNDLDSLDAVDRQKLFQKAHEVIRLKQMPPEETEQPTRAEREVLLNWLQTQLTGKAAKAHGTSRSTESAACSKCPRGRACVVPSAVARERRTTRTSQRFSRGPNFKPRIRPQPLLSSRETTGVLTKCSYDPE